MITMVAFTTERGNPNKIGFNLIYINLKNIYENGGQFALGSLWASL